MNGPDLPELLEAVNAVAGKMAQASPPPLGAGGFVIQSVALTLVDGEWRIELGVVRRGEEGLKPAETPVLGAQVEEALLDLVPPSCRRVARIRETAPTLLHDVGEGQSD